MSEDNIENVRSCLKIFENVKKVLNVIIYFLIPFHKYFVNEIPHFLGTFMNSSITNCGKDIKHDLLLRRRIHTLCDVRPLPTLDVSLFQRYKFFTRTTSLLWTRPIFITNIY